MIIQYGRRFLIGDDRSHLFTSILVGLVYGIILYSVGFIELHPSNVIIGLVLVPSSIIIAQRGGGLIPAIIGPFPYAFYGLWKYPLHDSWRGPPTPFEVLPESLLISISAGVCGFVFIIIIKQYFQKPKSWIPLGLYGAIVLILSIIYIFLDKVIQSCFLISC